MQPCAASSPFVPLALHRPLFADEGVRRTPRGASTTRPDLPALRAGIRRLELQGRLTPDPRVLSTPQVVPRGRLTWVTPWVARPAKNPRELWPRFVAIQSQKPSVWSSLVCFLGQTAPLTLVLNFLSSGTLFRQWRPGMSAAPAYRDASYSVN